MKKTKKKAGSEPDKKTLRKDLESSIINDLKIIVSTLGSGSDKLGKKITKEAHKLAKKLSEEITPHKNDNVTPVMDATKIAEVKEATKEPSKPASAKKKVTPNPEPLTTKSSPKAKSSK